MQLPRPITGRAFDDVIKMHTVKGVYLPLPSPVPKDVSNVSKPKELLFDYGPIGSGVSASGPMGGGVSASVANGVSPKLSAISRPEVSNVQTGVQLQQVPQMPQRKTTTFTPKTASFNAPSPINTSFNSAPSANKTSFTPTTTTSASTSTFTSSQKTFNTGLTTTPTMMKPTLKPTFSSSAPPVTAPRPTNAINSTTSTSTPPATGPRPTNVASKNAFVAAKPTFTPAKPSVSAGKKKLPAGCALYCYISCIF